MAATYVADKLLGAWTATNQLWLTPDHEAQESQSEADIKTLAQGQFISLAYTWAYEGQPQDGLLLFHRQKTAPPAKAVWVDSFHTGGQAMIFDESWPGGWISLLTTYPAPDGPDWGWRIDIGPAEAGSFTVRMFNITPDGKEYPAVLARYRSAAERE
jgi:hypothetical protein